LVGEYVVDARTRCTAEQLLLAPVDVTARHRESAASTNVFLRTASLEISESALTASFELLYFAPSFFAAVICASKSVSLNSGSVLMNASRIATSEPSRTPSAEDMSIIACSNRMSSVGFFAGALPKNFPSKPIVPSLR
jgi:hypothetical protein